MEETMFADRAFCIILNHLLNEKDKHSQKVVIAEEEQDNIGIDDIGNLEDLPLFVFIDEECGNFKVAE